MSEFLYYFPAGKHALDKAAWQALCCSHNLQYLSKAAPTVRACRGPDNSDGVVVAARTSGDGGAPGYYPDKQVWRNCGGYWLGATRGELPGQDELRHKEQLPGHSVELADGSEWLMPYAIVAPGTLALPRIFGVDADGNDALSVHPRYQDFADKAERFWNAVGDSAGAQITANYDELLALAVSGLSLNYRVGENELRMLGVLDTSNIWQLCFAAIDWPSFESMLDELVDAQKKTDNPPADGG